MKNVLGIGTLFCTIRKSTTLKKKLFAFSVTLVKEEGTVKRDLCSSKLLVRYLQDSRLYFMLTSRLIMHNLAIFCHC